jgi:hypothetical protein
VLGRATKIIARPKLGFTQVNMPRYIGLLLTL